MPNETPHADPGFEFARRVRAYRQALSERRGEKVSLETVALAMRKDRKFVQRMESGKANPTLNNLLLLAQVLEVDPCELVTGLEPPPERVRSPRRE